MKKFFKLAFMGLIVILFTHPLKAQLSGVITIPNGTYPDLASVVTALNSFGVTGTGVTINIIAGNPQTAPVGGYLLGSNQLNSTAGTRTVTFNGNGNVITAPVGTSTTSDGIFIISGTDNITVNNLNLSESASNTTPTTAMEYGYAFFNLRSSFPFDGCQNNTIQNCTVTLNRTIATPSKAIYMAHRLYNSTTTLSGIMTAADYHNNNKFYSNTLTNCVTGIYLESVQDKSDVGNDIGGNSIATGNTINNVIGNLINNAGAITCFYQTNCNISYNNINNAANGGTNATLNCRGININGPLSFSFTDTCTITNNTITLTEAAASSTSFIYGIYNNSASGGMTANNNSISFSEPAGSVASAYFGLYSFNGRNATINNNSIIHNMGVPFSGGYGVYISNGGNVDIQANTFTQTSSVGSGNFTSIYTESSSSENIRNNIFSNISITEGELTLINSQSPSKNKIISGNTISGTVTHNSSSNFYGIIDYSANSFNNGKDIISNNTLSNIVKSGTGNIYAIYGSLSAPTNRQSLFVSNNTISNITHSGTGLLAGVYYFAGNSDSIYNNQIYSLTSGGSVYGIYGTTPLNTLAAKLFKNNIYNLSSTGAAGSVYGITVAAGTTTTVSNNFIAGLQAAAASSTSDVIRGISVQSTTTNSSINLYHNSIYLNASSSGTNFSSSGIFHTANATATTAALTMVNNIVVNTSTPKGTGLSAAYRRSGTALSNFATSDYNLLYAGGPSPSRLIFYDGTNRDQTLAAYQARVSTKEVNSISVMPVFTSSTDLHLTTANCQIDGRGTPVAAVTDDIDDQVRNVTTPDIGADEFTAAPGTAITTTNNCETRNVSVAGTIYRDNTCNMIARVLPTGGATAVNGNVKTCATLDASQLYFNGEPYVQRHYDIEPDVSASAATATVTLYFSNAEFAQYNSNNPAFPTLPTIGAGNTVANKNNLRITQFHGTGTGNPTSPGNYPGTRELITPGSANVILNGTTWEVSFAVTGFSGFYAHSTLTNSPLPVVVNYLTGQKQGNNHLLNWKVTCTNSPRATMILERSSDAVTYIGITSITADAARCNQPFNYTDIDPLQGINYYRLKIADADGKVTYSSTVALLNAAKGFNIISIVPNPVSGDHVKLNIASAQADKVVVSIFDMQGRLVIRQAVALIAGFNSTPINIATLAPGTYNIRCSTSDIQTKVMRFVKQ